MSEYRANRDRVMQEVRGSIWSDQDEKVVSRTLAYQLAELQDRCHELFAPILEPLARFFGGRK